MTIPKYARIDEWCRISGMGRSTTYIALARGELTAIKLGTKTLVDVQAGLAWMDKLPRAAIGRGKSLRAVAPR